jgi:hemolysin activation/secretion protein
MLSEQMLLDGADALSGFSAGSLNVDRGATIRPEFSRPMNVSFWNIQANLIPYLFGAWGRGALDGPQASNNGTIQAESVGGGLRADTNITGAPFGESLSVEFCEIFF